MAVTAGTEAVSSRLSRAEAVVVFCLRRDAAKLELFSPFFPSAGSHPSRTNPPPPPHTLRRAFNALTLPQRVGSRSVFDAQHTWPLTHRAGGLLVVRSL